MACNNCSTTFRFKLTYLIWNEGDLEHLSGIKYQILLLPLNEILYSAPMWEYKLCDVFYNTYVTTIYEIRTNRRWYYNNNYVNTK